MLTTEQIAALAAGLAEVLGHDVPATPEGVAGALEELKAMLVPSAPAEGEVPADAAAMSVALKAALGVAEDASEEDALNAIEALKSALVPPAPKTDKLAAAVKAARDTKVHGNGIVHATKTSTGAKAQGRKDTDTPLRDMVANVVARKSQNYEIGSAGGFVVNQVVSGEIIGQLRANLVLEQAGARVITMPDAAVMYVPKAKSSPNAYWVGVNTAVPESGAAFDVVALQPRALAARFSIPVRMLDTMPAEAEAYIRREAERSLRLELERAALLGTGALTGTNTGSEPLGLLHMAGVQETALGSGNGAAPTLDDLQDALGEIEESNVMLTKPGYIMAPRTSNYFLALNDLQGQPLNRIARNGREIEIDGVPVYRSNIVPTNVTTGSNSDTSYVFAGNWENFIVGMGRDIQIRVFDDSRYMDNLQVGILAYMWVDFAVDYPEAFHILTGVRN